MIELQNIGIDQLTNGLQILLSRAPEACAQALREESELMMTEAKMRTPVHTGALRASGHVDGPTMDGNVIETVLGFGGASAPYAIYVHENMEAHHPVGQAKFLESVVLEWAPNLANKIADRVLSLLGLS